MKGFEPQGSFSVRFKWEEEPPRKWKIHKDKREGVRRRPQPGSKGDDCLERKGETLGGKILREI